MPDATPIAVDNPLTGRIAGFVDHLRLNDFAVGPAETSAALAMLARGDLADRDASRRALKILLSGRHEEWRRFDDLFEAYWFGRGRVRTGAGSADSRSTTRRPTIWGDHLEAESGSAAARHGVRAGEPGADGRQSTSRLVASEQKNIQKTDLRHVAQGEEIAEAERLARRLAAAIRHRICRRYRTASKPTRLDLRRTIRRNIGHGGEPIHLLGRARPDRPVRLVVFLDVSGSMKLYSRFFLQFVKGLVCEWIRADAYLVHTRLIRVTDALAEKDAIKAMTRLALMAEGFGGGTKLGPSLKAFNDLYARQATDSRTVAIVLSDGYDTGAPELLQAELIRLKRRVRRLVWLNPVLGWRDYEPITRAMTLAMPLIDHFAAANTLEALAAIEDDLARL